ncbi:MAG: hypothetical protein P4M12_03310 [Gammaproteobacteria bacterium]|nr:hypothetical protein [Gammaproteobacteria bacterium]
MQSGEMNDDFSSDVLSEEESPSARLVLNDQGYYFYEDSHEPTARQSATSSAAAVILESFKASQKSILNCILRYMHVNKKNVCGYNRANELYSLIESAKTQNDLIGRVKEFLKEGKTQADKRTCSFFFSMSRSSRTHEQSLRGMLIDNFVCGKAHLTRNARAEDIISSLKNKTFEDNFVLFFSEVAIPVFVKSEKSDYMKIVSTRAIY